MSKWVDIAEQKEEIDVAVVMVFFSSRLLEPAFTS